MRPPLPLKKVTWKSYTNPSDPPLPLKKFLSNFFNEWHVPNAPFCDIWEKRKTDGAKQAGGVQTMQVFLEFFACVPPGKITQSWKKTRARARHFWTLAIIVSFMRFHANFEVQKCAWNKIILHRVHALFRDPLRGGRDHFTARKFDQIPGRLDKFGDFLTKIVRFEVFSRLVFYLLFKICWWFQFLFQNFS